MNQSTLIRGRDIGLRIAQHRHGVLRSPSDAIEALRSSEAVSTTSTHSEYRSAPADLPGQRPGLAILRERIERVEHI